MKTIVGYIPPAIVIIPFATAWTRQSLYYKGCMDGAEFVFTAFFAFIVGGVLNLAFLASRFACRKRFLSGMTLRQRRIAKASVSISIATLLFQLGVIGYLALQKLSL